MITKDKDIAETHLKLLAPAKLNLGLKVIGKKSNGHHLLHTIFCLINWYDEIEIQSSRHDLSIILKDHHNKWAIKQDLTFRAALLMQSRFKIKKGVVIKNTKNIPCGSGLGGGSSDAAAVILALNRMWKLNLTKEELINIAVTLGADVPFFIFGQSALGQGIGEILSPLPFSKQYFVLVNPNIHASTKLVFENMNSEIYSKNAKLSDQELTSHLMSSYENDLEQVALMLYPELEAVVTELKTYGEVHMTGSGSMLYFVCKTQNDAIKLAKKLQIKYNPYLVESIPFGPIFI